MQNLIQFLIKYGYLGLFLLLQFICFTLIVKYNQSQKEIWVNSSHLYMSKLSQRFANVNQYFDLKTENDSIQADNAKLIEQIINFRIYDTDNTFNEFVQKDTMPYKVIPARVTSKVVNQANNFITINKGALDDIRPDMGVISSKGLVGTVIAVSDHFAKVMLLLNSQSQLSSNIVNSDFFGTLKWDTGDNTTMYLDAVPKFADISKGDTIVTSGFSTLFPKGIMIGRVEDFSIPEGSNNYSIKVKLSEDPTLVNLVYVIDAEYAEEERELNMADDELQ